MLKSIRQLEAVRDEWDALAAPFGSPLLDHDWFVCCANAFHRGQELSVVTVHDGRSLVAAAPLVREGTPAGHRLMLLGASRLGEPGEWLFASDGALAALAGEAVRVGQPMILQRIPEDSPIGPALAALPLHRAITVSRGGTTSLAVPVRGTWDAYYASLSSHITGNLRRLRRKAERALGPVQVSRLDPRPGEVGGLLETIVSVEGSGWKGRRGSALGARADLLDFFRRYCERAAERRRLRVATLSFGSHVAAVELSVEAYNRMWQLKIGYNDALASYYPGLHLTESSIRATFERGLAAYEFLGNAAAWEERWAPETRRYQTLVTYPLTAAGVFTMCRDVARLACRRAQATAARQPLIAGEA